MLKSKTNRATTTTSTVGVKLVNFTNKKAAQKGIAINPALLSDTNTLSLADLALISNIDNLLLNLRGTQDFE